jgi:hypothetical protein
MKKKALMMDLISLDRGLNQSNHVHSRQMVTLTTIDPSDRSR